MELREAILELREAIWELREAVWELREAIWELREAIVELQETILRVQRVKTLILLVFSMKNEGLGGPGSSKALSMVKRAEGGHPHWKISRAR